MLPGKFVVVSDKKAPHASFCCLSFSKKFQEKRILEEETESFTIFLFLGRIRTYL